MNPNELRIGNHAKWSDYASMGIGECVVDYSSLGYYSLLEPIPLTEEWLFKFGFTLYDKDVHPNDREYFMDDLDLQKYVDGNSYYSHNLPSWVKNISYVHQLQNLYWCLTGQELELKY